MYYEFIQANKRRIIGGVIAIIAFVGIWTAVDFVSHIGKLPVVISTAPSDAKITVDNRSYGNGTSWIVPGKYAVTVEKDGFKKDTETIIITGQKTQNVVAVSLVPQSDQAKKWATDHQADYAKNQQYGGIEASANGEYFAKLHPIVDQLPFTDPYFKIGYTENRDQSVTLTISTPSPRYRFYAIEKLRKMGYDPTDFVIQFKDFHNPLEQPR